MKKWIWLFAAVLTMGLTGQAGVFASEGAVDAAEAPKAQEHSAKSKMKKAGPVVYACPMDPEVLSDKPGTCPKCGMDLVKKGKKKAMEKLRKGSDTK